MAVKSQIIKGIMDHKTVFPCLHYYRVGPFFSHNADVFRAESLFNVKSQYRRPKQKKSVICLSDQIISLTSFYRYQSSSLKGHQGNPVCVWEQT